MNDELGFVRQRSGLIERETMLKTVTKIGVIATGALFTVYFLNLDQKLLAWAYARVNEIFDRKEVDIKF